MTTNSGPSGADSHPTPPLNSSALSVADAVKLFSRVGGVQVTPAMIDADRLAGAPANPDGTLNLLHYAAWLAKESNVGD